MNECVIWYTVRSIVFEKVFEVRRRKASRINIFGDFLDARCNLNKKNGAVPTISGMIAEMIAGISYVPPKAFAIVNPTTP